jgi:hypothetical protein
MHMQGYFTPSRRILFYDFYPEAGSLAYNPDPLHSVSGPDFQQLRFKQRHHFHTNAFARCETLQRNVLYDAVSRRLASTG